MSDHKIKKSWNVSKATRDAVVGTAKRVQLLREKTTEITRKAKKTWEGSGLVDFGNEVRNGFKEGMDEVNKNNKET
jgi:hypothetical protein